MTLFGLHGGLGNMLFALPALKALARRGDVDLVVEGDYAASGLFGQCRYARRVYGAGNHVSGSYQNRLCGDVAPESNGPWQRCGWPRPARPHYPFAEWEQILRLATGRKERENVSDWIDVPKVPLHDFGIVPCGKPGSEWERKKWPRYADLAARLGANGWSVASFGSKAEVEAAALGHYWTGEHSLADLPAQLAACRVLIGNDCGPMHLASSLGLPCVFIFTATSKVKGDPVGDPHFNVKLGGGCDAMPDGCQTTETWRRCKNWVCRGIEVEQVFHAALALYRKAAGYPLGEVVP